MHSQHDELLSVEGAFFSPDEKNRLVDEGVASHSMGLS